MERQHLSSQGGLSIAVSQRDHVAGPADAPIVVVEYVDFECPICRAFEPAVQQLRHVYKSQLAFVFRHFPFEEAHPNALLAAEAAEAAGAQGRFWDMHDRLLQPRQGLSRADLEDCAQSVGLDMTRFRRDLDGGVHRSHIKEDQAGGRASHLRASPGFFVNCAVQDVSGGMQPLFETVARILGD